jgi:GPI ethanolamine phosphate transferase 1
MAYGASFILLPTAASTASASFSSAPRITALSALALALSWALFAIERAPWTFYLYTVFPCYFWHEALSALANASHLKLGRSVNLRTTAKYLAISIATIAALQSMVVRFPSPTIAVSALDI